MKDKIATATAFARRYRYPLIYTAGALMGATVMYKLTSSDDVGKDVLLEASSEMLQRLIDEPAKGGIKWENAGQEIILINNLHP